MKSKQERSVEGEKATIHLPKGLKGKGDVLEDRRAENKQSVTPFTDDTKGKDGIKGQ